MRKKYLAEFIGTFALVFCGTGAIIIDQQTNGAVTHAGVAATFGLIILAMIYTFGESSGAHFNPAVTIGFAVSRRFPARQVIPYIVCQILGAFAATFILKLMFPGNQDLGNSLPSGSYSQSFAMEFILTYFLMMVIINVSQGSKETGILAGIAIGATILLEAMFAGPISGASMNPARSLSPAIVTGNIDALWIYILAPIGGAVLAVMTWHFMQSNKNYNSFRNAQNFVEDETRRK